MSTQQNTIDFILDQIAAAGNVSARKMFGEYGVYCDGKIFALVCNDQLFIKPTEAGRIFICEVEEAAPYQGAKPYLFISGDKWDDQEWLSDLVKITIQALPIPKLKKKASHKAE
jgi:TfoX/Sxy family transcriptional regulator of competence genes